MNKKDYEFAYKYIYNLLDCDKESMKWPLTIKSMGAFKELVEKATPKKVIERKHQDHVVGPYYAYYCPCCDYEQVIIIKKENQISGWKAPYCRNCGQKLDWSVKDQESEEINA